MWQKRTGCVEYWVFACHTVGRERNSLRCYWREPSGVKVIRKEVFDMIHIRKKDRETPESMIRRFSRRVQQSGVLQRVRKNRFRLEEKSRTKRREEALYKVKIRKEIDRLKKLGKFDEESLREVRKRLNR